MKTKPEMTPEAIRKEKRWINGEILKCLCYDLPTEHLQRDFDSLTAKLKEAQTQEK